MPVRRLWPGTKHGLYAWVNAEGCQVEVFLTKLKEKRKLDWQKIFPLIVQAAEFGPPENDEQCRLVSGEKANDLYEFVTRGGVRVFWFYDGDKLVLCCGTLSKSGNRAPTTVVDEALSIKRQYWEEKSRESLK